MTAPPDHTPPGSTELKLGAVPKYLRDKFLLDVTRQTVYNWVHIGRRGEYLKYASIPPPTGSCFNAVRVTTQEWVDDFIHRSGLRGEASVPG